MSIRLDLVRPVSDEELLALSARNPGYRIERTAEGRLAVSPTGGDSGRRSGEVFRQLGNWSRLTHSGPAFDSSTGFNLPDGSCLSPDASWVRRERWDALSRPQRQGYPPLCPDAVFEVRSASDSLPELRANMRLYLDNGARLAVLVDPEAQLVEVHRPGRLPERREGSAPVALDPELPGFSLDPAGVFAD